MLTPLALLLFAAPPPQDTSEIDEAYEILGNVERVTPVVQVVQAVTPSVVYVETEYVQQGRSVFWGPWERRSQGSGSGVVVHPSGYIVTNYHVVKGAQRIRVSFAGDPQTYTAQMVSFVRAEDLALLKVSNGGTYPTVRLGTSSDLWPGERVVAIGNPHGQTHTVSTGIISGLQRDVEIPDQNLVFRDLIQTDASINLGNSGGPLLNIRGELIGINTAMNTRAENIGFAIPVDRVREVLNDLLYPQARKSWLGFELADGDGLRVGSVLPGGPAAAAGICEGDQILAIAGEPLENRDQFIQSTLKVDPHERIRVDLARLGERSRVDITSWDRVDGLLFERMGLTVSEQAIGRQNWVFVDRLREGGPALESGLVQGDLIPAVRPHAGRFTPWRVHGRDILARIVQDLEPGVEMDIDVYRDRDGDRRYSRDERYRGTLRIR